MGPGLSGSIWAAVALGEVLELNEKVTVLAPSGMLGYGIPAESFNLGMGRDPDVIAIDAGSTDPGPYYLGAGVSYTNRNLVKKDLALDARRRAGEGIPVLVGTAGGGGGRPHLEWLMEIAREICQERGYHSTWLSSRERWTRNGSSGRS